VFGGPAVLRGTEERGSADENAADQGKKKDGGAVGGRDVFGLNDNVFPHSGEWVINRDAAYDQADDAPNHWNAVIRVELDFLHVPPRM
jgi:hypothetical protein